MVTQLAWSTERRRLGDLAPHKFNPRLATEKFKQTLTRLLKKFGLVEIPAIDLDGGILAGHQRIVARGRERQEYHSHPRMAKA